LYIPSPTFKPYRHLKTLECGDLLRQILLDKTMILWSGTNYSLFHRYERRSCRTMQLGIFCITSAFSVTNGKYILTGSEDNCVYLWDLQHKTILQRLQGHTEALVSVSCHQVQKNHLDKTIRIWKQDT
ncbi:hypothetical protein HID58_014191, partial [Brassica napus]